MPDEVQLVFQNTPLLIFTSQRFQSTCGKGGGFAGSQGRFRVSAVQKRVSLRRVAGSVTGFCRMKVGLASGGSRGRLPYFRYSECVFFRQPVDLLPLPVRLLTSTRLSLTRSLVAAAGQVPGLGAIYPGQQLRGELPERVPVSVRIIRKSELCCNVVRFPASVQPIPGGSTQAGMLPSGIRLPWGIS